MSNLRNQLEKAVVEYQAIGYPGDLASEVLPSSFGINPKHAPKGNGVPGAGVPLMRQRWWWAGTGGAAAAAVLAVGFYMVQGTRNTAGPSSPSGSSGPLIFLTPNGMAGVPQNSVPNGGGIPIDFNLNRGMNNSAWNRFQLENPSKGLMNADFRSDTHGQFSDPDLTIQPKFKNGDYTGKPR